MNWEILLKHINNESNEAENREVELWLNEQAENEYLLDYLKKRKKQLEQPLKQHDIHEQWVLLVNRIFEAPPSISKSKSLKSYWFTGIAASLLLIALSTRLYRSYTTDSIRTIVLKTPDDRRGRVSLPDGSEVYLAPDSKLTYNTAFGTKKRELYFTGEAFFNIKHNAHSPFIIHTDNHVVVNVLGTSFNVYSRTNQPTEVKVATGLVGIVANNQTHFLSTGQQLDYLAGKQIVLEAVAHNDAAALQNETLYFKNNNTAEIAEKLRRWYNIQVEILPSAAKHPHFSGEMKDTGLNNLMAALGYATGLHYTFKNPHTLLLF